MIAKSNKNKTLLQLEPGECRWPNGDPRHADFHFCGATQAPGRPYCKAHWTMSFDQSKQRGSSSVSALTVRKAA